MPKYPGRRISATPPSVSLSGASGVWTLEEVAQYEQAGTWPVATGGNDPYFNQTVLLLHGDGTNGAQNNTFLDSSSNNFTITRNPATGPNAPTQGTFSPFSVGAGEWSNFFDGSGDYLSIPDNAAFDFGSGNFTIEAWVYPSDVTPSKAEWIVSQWQSDTQNSWGVRVETNGELRFWYSTAGNTASNIAATTPGINENAWNHIAVVRNGNDLTIYVNGVSKATGSLSGVTLHNSTASVIVAGQANTGLNQNFTGYVSNLRLVKGRAVYTSAFTPSTVPLGATSGGTNPPQGTETSLLTCQSNRFVDNGGLTTKNTITRNGDVRVTPFSPFAPTAAYDASVNGGSGYFVSAIGNYLSAGTSTTLALGAGNFCIECWIYLLAYNSNTSIIFDYRTAGGSVSNIPALALQTNGQPSFYFQVASPVINGSKVVPLNTWTHLAIVRNGSSTNNCTMYMNGESIGTATNTSNLGIQTLAINNPQSGTNFNTNAWFADFRIVTGSPVYTGAFTPPTAPLTAITNTKLLLNFTNAGIIDNTGKNVLETVGNAQIDTTTKKYGTGSLEFDGTGDYLQLNSSTNDLFNFGTGDFTIECWFYRGSLSGRQDLLGRYVSTPAGWGLGTSVTNNGDVVFYYGNTVIASTAGSIWSINTWSHVAVVRSATSLVIYVNGTSRATATDSTNMSAGNPLQIGASGSTSVLVNGYIDDLRITKDVARYPTEPFPTAPFPDL